jgi:hypothetical protein
MEDRKWRHTKDESHNAMRGAAAAPVGVAHYHRKQRYHWQDDKEQIYMKIQAINTERQKKKNENKFKSQWRLKPNQTWYE